MATAQADVPTSHDATLGTCPCCGEDVLIVDMAGESIPVEPREILAQYPCPRCADVRNRGNQRKRICEMCFGSEVLGEELPPYGIAVDAYGQAREFTRRKRLREYESAHLPHTCELRHEAAARAAA